MDRQMDWKIDRQIQTDRQTDTSDEQTIDRQMYEQIDGEEN